MPRVAAFLPIFDGAFTLRWTPDGAHASRTLAFSVPNALDRDAACCLLWELRFSQDQNTDVELSLAVGDRRSAAESLGRFQWPGPPQSASTHVLVRAGLVRPGANSLYFVAHPTVSLSGNRLVGQEVHVRDVVLWYQVVV